MCRNLSERASKSGVALVQLVEWEDRYQWASCLRKRECCVCVGGVSRKETRDKNRARSKEGTFVFVSVKRCFGRSLPRFNEIRFNEVANNTQSLLPDRLSR